VTRARTGDEREGKQYDEKALHYIVVHFFR